MIRQPTAGPATTKLLTCLLIASSLVSLIGSAAAEQKSWAIALHGGAGRLPRDLPPATVAEYRAALERALRTGKEALERGETALDAAQETVVVLEDCPLFNAGCGAVFDREGGHTLDASIMDGSTLACGGVASLTTIKNPIRAARLVMDQTPHVLMGGREAEALAASHGLRVVPRSYFSVPRRFKQMQRGVKRLGLDPPESPKHGWPVDQPAIVPHAVEGVGGTVGCVALDKDGKLAAATSTGGRSAKLPGRIGDSPIAGAGNYANAAAAFGGTGKGEEYIRHFITGRAAWLVESGTMTLEQAANHCLDEVLQPGDGGLIGVDADGNLVLRSTTGSMPRGAADSEGRFEVGIWFD